MGQTFLLRLISLGLILFLTSSCASTPYSLTVGKYNESGPQTPAAITISDPQIYARETLVNDRLRESKLLETLLEESSVVEGDKDFRKKFTPQLRRDLETYQAFIGELAATFNPLSGKQETRAERFRELDFQKEEYAKLAELENAKRAYEKALKGDSADVEEAIIMGDELVTPETPVTTPVPTPTTPATPPATPSEVAVPTEGAVETGTNQEEQKPDVEETDPDMMKLVRNKLNDIDGKIKSLKDKMIEKAANASAITTDPRDAFRDLAAYRAELRQAQSAINLDDLHDFAGNSLYRLQFRASVFPSTDKDKLGVARLTFERPKITEEEINSLYYTWLAHVGGRLNNVSFIGGENEFIPDVRLLRLQSSGMFKVIKVNSGEKLLFQAGVHPELHSYIYEVMKVFREKDQIQFEIDAKRLGAAGARQNYLENFFSNLIDFGAKRTQTTDTKVCMYVFALEHYQTAVRNATIERDISSDQIKLVVQQELVISDILEVFYKYLSGYSEDEISSGNKLFGVGETRAFCVRKLNYYEGNLGERGVPRVKIVSGQLAAPGIFSNTLKLSDNSEEGDYFLDDNDFCTDEEKKHALRRSAKRNTVLSCIPNLALYGSDSVVERELLKRESGIKTFVPKGDAYAYTVKPLELSQRLSTTARNTNSLELAMAASAALQGKGINGDLGIGYVRQAAGNIEALERTPIVVGFAERESEVERDIQPLPERFQSFSKSEDLRNRQNPQVGWVFAPPARINAKKGRLDYVQSPTAYEVSADLSAPGWWPHMVARLETAWIGNWKNTGQPIRINQQGEGYHVEKFRLRLPTNRADLDALTNYISNRTIGQTAQLANIESITPWKLSACSKDVEIIMRGANLWRSSEVYLGGVKSDDVRVLPDMEGIVARFNLDRLYETNNAIGSDDLNQSEWIDLSVQTRNGNVETSVKIIGHRTPKRGDTVASCRSSLQFSGGDKNDYSKTISSILPSTINSCSDSVNLTLDLDNSVKKPRVFLNGQKGEVVDRAGTLLITEFKGPFAQFENQPAEITVVDNDEAYRGLVPVKACSKPAAKKPEAPKSAAMVPAQLHSTYSIANNTMSFEIPIGLKGDAKTLPSHTHIGIRPKAATYADPPVKSTGPVVQSAMAGATHPYRVQFEVDLAQHKRFKNHADNGREYEFIMLNTKSDGSTSSEKIDGSVILYADGHQNAKLSKDVQSDSYEKFVLKIDLPVNYEKAYPLLSLPATGLKIKSDNNDFNFVAKRTDITPTDATYDVELIIKESDKKEAEILALKNHFGDATKAVDLTFEFDTGVVPGATPKILSKGGSAPGVLKLKKK